VTSSGPQTRGFLFADLRGYSAFTEQHGDHASAELLGRYRELVRREIAAFHGAEIRTEGDSFYVVFDSVSEAVQAGVAIRDGTTADPGPHPIRVGIGIHAGETTDGEQGIVSSAVNVAARVCAQAEAGEVLVTETVRSLTRTFLPFRFTPRGSRRLKGISEPVRIFSVQPGTSAALATPTDRRRRVVKAAAGFALIALVVVAVGIALANRDAASQVGQQPSASTGIATSSPAGTHDLSRFSDPGEFPNDAEQALLERLPSRIASGCQRADDAEVPTFGPGTGPEGAPTAERLRVRAGVSCLTGTTRVTYWQKTYERGITTEDLFYNLVIKRSLEEGSCVARHRAFEAWEAGAHSGHVMCYPRGESAVLEWSYEDADIYAIASRLDGDMEALLAWWHDVGRLLSR
jgi:class 3 adenylate cyclase